MFSSALKSFSSNIASNYIISPQPNSASGPWRIFEAKRKSSGKVASVFVFDKKSLEPQGGGLSGRNGPPSLKQAQQEVISRLRLEASALARLRHPNILELVEPVEETRNGGLMFATELVTASLSSLLADLDDRDRSGTGKTRSSRYTVQETGSTASKEFELDELEIQKGLLQIARGLEFLHESAGLVHSNLTPDAIFINSKGDWKLAGMAFTGPASDSDKATSFCPIHLSEMLNHDPRLPPSVQLNLDYTSPDFCLDNQVVTAADLFSLGMIIIALYNAPHSSPIECHGSVSAYKRTFASSSTVPTQGNKFLAKGKLPHNLTADLLPKLITRRSANRLTAKSLQQAQYFDNILVSTIRFLDDLPAKSVTEKMQFLRGLPRIMSQFPGSVLEKKVLPVLLDEMKDKELLSAILQNIFAIIKASPDGKRPFTDLVIPKLRDIFLRPVAKSVATDRDLTKEAGLMVILENMQIVADNTSGKEFRDDILPIIAVGLGSSTHSLIDASLATLPFVTPKLDYTTIKNELFPVIAGVFAHTNSLAIKIQGLEAFYTLCGGTETKSELGDGLDGTVTLHNQDKTSSSAVLDKFTVQEKIVPLLKGIKTKEPAVMMTALKVLRQVGQVVDTDYLAIEVLPILWSFALGPLLDLTQFQAFMALIKSLSGRIEREHSHKLKELRASNAASGAMRATHAQPGGMAPTSMANGASGEDVDFESLVAGRNAAGTPDIINEWDSSAATKLSNGIPNWTSQSSTAPFRQKSLAPSNSYSPASAGLRQQHLTSAAPTHRTVTPDQSLSSFAPLTPSSAFNAPLQPTPNMVQRPAMAPSVGSGYGVGQVTQQPQRTTGPAATGRIDWTAASASASSKRTNLTASSYLSSTPAITAGNSTEGEGMRLASPPPSSPSLGAAAPQPTMNGYPRPPVLLQPLVQRPAQQQKPKGSGLDKYESLL